MQRPGPAAGVGPAVLGGQEELADQLDQALARLDLDDDADLLAAGFQKSWATPGGTWTRVPGPASSARPSWRTARRPRTVVKASVGTGWTCSPATLPPGRRYRSTTSRWPLAPVRRDAHDPALAGDRVLVELANGGQGKAALGCSIDGAG